MVVELVDTPDSKSGERIARAGSSPAHGTKKAASNWSYFFVLASSLKLAREEIILVVYSKYVFLESLARTAKNGLRSDFY